MNSASVPLVQARNPAIHRIVLAAIVFGSLALANYLRPVTPDTEMLASHGYHALGQKEAIRTFSLTDQDGQPAGVTDLQGQWSLVFFGFTACPDVCPTTLGVLNQLASEITTVQVILVSVDPQRDTPAHLKSYLQGFNPDFIGLTGDVEELQAFAYQLHAAFRLLPAKPDDTIEHSSNIALLDPSGNFIGYFSIPHRPENMRTVLELVAGL